MAKLVTGDWQLTLGDDTEPEVRIDSVEMDEEEGFHAEGRDEEAEKLSELTTQRFGEPVRLRRRAMRDEEWEELGEVVYAER